MKNFPQIIKKIIGVSDEKTLENRVLDAAIFFSSMIASVILIENLVFTLPAVNIIVVCCANIFFWSLYIMSKKNPGNSWVLWLYIRVSSILVITIWLVLGQYNGLALPFFVGISGIIPLITKENKIVAEYIFISIIYIILLFSVVLLPQQFSIEPNQVTAVIINIVEVGIIATALSMVSFLSISFFRREKSKNVKASNALKKLNENLSSKNHELKVALDEVKNLREIIPICSHCKKIRDDKGYWKRLEVYFAQHTDIQLTHGICPECMAEKYPETYKELKDKGLI